MGPPLPPHTPPNKVPLTPEMKGNVCVHFHDKFQIIPKLMFNKNIRKISSLPKLLGKHFCRKLRQTTEEISRLNLLANVSNSIFTQITQISENCT